MMALVATIAALVCYAGVAMAAGQIVLRLVWGPVEPEESQSPLALCALAFVIGLGVLAQLWTLLALAGAFTYVSVLLVGAGAVILSSRICRPPILRALLQARSLQQRWRAEPFGWQLVAFVAVAWILVEASGLGHPLTGDALALHFLVPKLVAASGFLDIGPFQSANEAFGLIGELSLAPLFQYGQEDAAVLLAWLCRLASIVIVVTLSVALGAGYRGGIVVLALMAGTSAFYPYLGAGKIDLISSAIALAGCHVAIAAMLRAEGLRSWGLAGLLIGTAIVAKLIYALTLLPLMLLFLVWRTRASMRGPFSWRGAVPVALRIGLPFALALLLALVPHVLKNAILLGNPLAPLDFGWTAELEHGEVLRQILPTHTRWHGPETRETILQFYPFVLIYGNYWSQSGHLSPLVLAFLPLLLLLPRPRPLVSSVLFGVTAAAWICIALWALLMTDKVVLRYIVVPLILTIPAIAIAVERVSLRRSASGRLFGGLAVLAILAVQAAAATSALGVHLMPVRAINKALGRQERCDGQVPTCPQMRALNRLVVPGDRALVVSTYRYFLDPMAAQCANRIRDSYRLAGTSAEERLIWLRTENFKFVLPDLDGNPGRLMEDLADPPEWLKVHRYFPDDPLSPILLEYRDPPAPVRRVCKEVWPGLWRVVESR